jgi:hypothetical protein
MSTSTFRRIVRRETHSPRTVAMIIAAALLIAALTYMGTGIVLYMLAQPDLLGGLTSAVAWIIGLPKARPGWLVVVGGTALGLLGLVFLFLALTPGRLPKHQMTCGARAIVVDNEVIASSLAQYVSDETGIPLDDITVGVSHRSADITLRPRIGARLDEAQTQDLVTAEVDSYRLTPSVKTSVRIIRPHESAADR